jgi:hypothetical protein
VATGSFQGDDVAAELEEAGFENAAETSGYDVFANGDRSLAFGVGDTLVRASGTDRSGADEVVATLVQSRENGETPYVSASTAFQTVLAGFSEGVHRVIETFDPVDDGDPAQGRFDGAVGLGVERSLARVTTDVKWIVVFEEESAVDLEALETWTESDEETFGHVRNVQISRQGRAGIITVTADTPDVRI